MDNDRDHDPLAGDRLNWPGQVHSEARREPSDKAAPPEQERVNVPASEVSTVSPLPSDASRVARFVADAYQRLADQISDDVRAVQGQMDSDVALLRSELTSLRHSVGDVAERVQLRQMKASVEELRSEMVSLRRAVLEWPELEQVSSDIALIRGMVDEMGTPDDGESRAGPDGGAVNAADVSALVAEMAELRRELVQEIADLRAEVTAIAESQPSSRLQVSALGPVLEELGELRQELVSLRRRISLRAQPS